MKKENLIISILSVIVVIVIIAVLIIFNKNEKKDVDLLHDKIIDIKEQEPDNILKEYECSKLTEGEMTMLDTYDIKFYVTTVDESYIGEYTFKDIEAYEEYSMATNETDGYQIEEDKDNLKRRIHYDIKNISIETEEGLIEDDDILSFIKSYEAMGFTCKEK